MLTEITIDTLNKVECDKTKWNHGPQDVTVTLNSDLKISMSEHDFEYLKEMLTK